MGLPVLLLWKLFHMKKHTGKMLPIVLLISHSVAKDCTIECGHADADNDHDQKQYESANEFDESDSFRTLNDIMKQLYRCYYVSNVILVVCGVKRMIYDMIQKVDFQRFCKHSMLQNIIFFDCRQLRIDIVLRPIFYACQMYAHDNYNDARLLLNYISNEWTPAIVQHTMVYSFNVKTKTLHNLSS